MISNIEFSKKNGIIFVGVFILIIIVCTGIFISVLQKEKESDSAKEKIVYDQLESLYKNKDYVSAQKILGEMNKNYPHTELTEKANATFRKLDELAKKEELEKPEKEAKAKQEAEAQKQWIMKQEEVRKQYQEDLAKEQENHIYIGDSKEKVLRIFGKPERINRMVNSNMVHEQWVYGSNYIYLENGVVTSWQDSE